MANTQLMSWSSSQLLNFYRWDADAVRDDLRGYVLNQLGDPAGVVVADETGFLEEGRPLGRGATAVFGHCRADRELPSWESGAEH
jgi:SRSO17 transposase